MSDPPGSKKTENRSLIADDPNTYENDRIQSRSQQPSPHHSLVAWPEESSFPTKPEELVDVKAHDREVTNNKIAVPEFKAQCNYHEDELPSGTQKKAVVREQMATLEGQSASVEANPEGDPIAEATNPSPTGEGSSHLPEVHLLNVLPEAEAFVEKRRLKRTLCCILVAVNSLIVGGLVAGGFCLTGHCEPSRDNEIEEPLPLDIVSNCAVDVELTCATSSGNLCSEVPGLPAPSCRGDLVSIEFKYRTRTCDDAYATVDSEEDSGLCTDIAPLLVHNMVEIRCFSQENDSLMVKPKLVERNDKFMVLAQRKQKLPSSFECQLRSLEGDVLQIVAIVASEDQELAQHDEFGALEIVDCSNLACLNTFTYNITVSNNEDIPVILSSLDLYQLNRPSLDLMGRVDSKLIMPKQALSVAKTVHVDYCQDHEYFSWALAEAHSDAWELCRIGDEFRRTISPTAQPPNTDENNPETRPEAQTQVPGVCPIDIDVECITDDGLNCSSVKNPLPLTCGSNLTMIRFRYDSEGTCNPEANQQGNFASCTDLEPLVDLDVNVRCEDTDGNHIPVVNSRVDDWDTFRIVFESGQFPSTIFCELVDSGSGLLMQENEINTSGNVALHRDDRFGAMRVVDCSDPSCVVTLKYTVTITNIGPTLLPVRSISMRRFSDRTMTSSVSARIDSNTAISKEFEFVLNPCIGDTAIDGDVVIVAEPTEGRRCQALTYFDPGDPLLEDCDVDAFVACSLSDGSPCTAIKRRQSLCSGQFFAALTFRYSTEQCKQDDEECTDFFALTPRVVVRCFDTSGLPLKVDPSIVWSSNNFTVSRTDGRVLADKIECFLLGRSPSDDDGTDDILLQRILFDMSLGLRIGAVELVECGDIACLETLSYNLTVRNDRLVGEATITELELQGISLYGTLLPYVENATVDPGKSSSVALDVQVDSCEEDIDVNAVPHAVVETTDGVECKADTPGGYYTRPRSMSHSHGGSSKGTTPPPPPPPPTPAAAPVSAPPPPSRPTPTMGPPAIGPGPGALEEDQGASLELIFGLAATGVALSLMSCMGVLLYIRRWEQRRKMPTK